MASLTATDRATQAVSNVQNGRVGFTVLATEEDAEFMPNSVRFLVAIPQALMRYGLMAGIAGATPTRLGIDLTFNLSHLDGVNASLKGEAPHIVMIDVNKALIGESDPSFGQMYRGLRSDICRTIERVIIAYSGRAPRLRERLRRLI